MAVFDTHRAFQALTAAGFTDRQAQALIDVGSEGYGALATKADVADMVTKKDLDTRLLALELRMRLYVGAYVAIAAALVVGILGFLLALFTGQFS